MKIYEYDGEGRKLDKPHRRKKFNKNFLPFLLEVQNLLYKKSSKNFHIVLMKKKTKESEIKVKMSFGN